MGKESTRGACARENGTDIQGDPGRALISLATGDEGANLHFAIGSQILQT